MVPTPSAGSAATDPSRRPAVDGWFVAPGLPVPDGLTDVDASSGPRLVGSRCAACHTYAFPPRQGPCPNPACTQAELEPTLLSPAGTVWSYTENHYAPPAPYVASDPFEPYALAAVELADEGLVVLGQVARGIAAADLTVGMPMRLGVQVLFTDDDGTDHVVWVWEPDRG
jgi:uncharacterized OB-fold protein